MKNKKAVFAVIASPFVAFVLIAVGVAVGSTSIDLSDVAMVFIRKLGFFKDREIAATTMAIVWNMRLPRVLLAFFTGAALSAGGAVIQSILKNPLASPYTLGVSTGASVGAGIVIAFGFTFPIFANLTLPIVGLTFALLTVFICIVFTKCIDKNMAGTSVILCGMVLSLFLNGIFTMVSGLSDDKMTRIIRWQMGSFASKGWSYVKILSVITILAITVIMFFSKELDLLSFGDETAKSIGVATVPIKLLMLILTAVLAGAAVSFSGVIGFIDLISPHIVRKLFSSEHKFVVFLSAMVGGCFMIIADLLARVIMPPIELPVGAVTAVIGAPFFAYIFIMRRKNDAGN